MNFIFQQFVQPDGAHLHVFKSSEASSLTCAPQEIFLHLYNLNVTLNQY